MTDSLDAKIALQTTLKAKTQAGRIFKQIVFWIAVIGMFVIPLGVLVLYFLWRHGNSVAQTSPNTAQMPTPIESTGNT